MKKPTVFVLIGGLVFGTIGAGAYLYYSRQMNTAASPLSDGISPTPSIAPVLTMWDDPAGFTLQYPEGLTVDKHDEDKEHYAHVEFTDAKHPGRIVVWVKDLPRTVTNTASWGSMAATPSSAISFDTTLDGKPAQKILISQPQKTMTTGVVYDGVLWYLEADLADEPYWQSVFETMTNSFVFKPLPEAAVSTGGGAAGGGIIVDEEEVLE